MSTCAGGAAKPTDIQVRGMRREAKAPNATGYGQHADFAELIDASDWSRG